MTKNLKEKLIESFKQHTNFDVTGGIHISGGTDSAILAALANIDNKKINSFTFNFENKNFSELDDAQQIAKSTGLPHFTSTLKDDDVESFLFDVLEKEFEPFSSLRILSQHFLYREYKDKAKVILDGSGGDEIGAGYIYYAISWYLDILGDNNVSREKKRFYNLCEKIKNDSISLQHFILGSLNQTFVPGTSTVDGSTYPGSNFLTKEIKKKILRY